MAAEPKPDGSGYSGDVIGRLLGLTIRRLQQLAKDGYIQPVGHGRYNLVNSVQGYVRFLKEDARKPVRDSEHSLVAREQREKLRLENMRTRGELLERAWVGETDQLRAATFSAQLDGLPGRVANELAAISEPADVRAKLLDETRIVREAMAKFEEDRAQALREAVDDGGDDLETAEEEDSLAVGRGEPDIPPGKRGTGEVSGEPRALLHSDSGMVRRFEV